MMSTNQIKQFFATNQLVIHDLGRLERQLGFDLGAVQDAQMVTADEDYYPQIQTHLRAEAARMGKHYEVFYSLENTIRQHITEILSAEADDWWTTEYIPGQKKGLRKAPEDREGSGNNTPIKRPSSLFKLR